MSDAQLDTSYREGGWSVRQVVHHLADSHSFAYTRFLRTFTEDGPLFEPYDEKSLAELPNAKRGSLEPSPELIAGLQRRWTLLLGGMTEADFQRSFFHLERGEVTLRHQLARTSWHGLHHTAQILGLRRRMGW